MRQLPFEYAFRNLGRSRLRLVALLVGTALVVLLVLAAGGFARGMQRTLSAGEALHENVIVLGTGSEESLERSQIDASVAGILTAAVRGVRHEAGIAFVSPEIHMALPVTVPGDDHDGARERQAVMRGVQPVALLVHPEIEMIEGRLPLPGAEEIMVGSMVGTRLGVADAALALGRTIRFDQRDWTVVGRFCAPATVMDAEVWIPLVDLQIATRREASLSCVVLTLDSGRFADVDVYTKSRLDLELSAMTEREYYRSLATFFRPIRVMVLVTAVLVASGGLLGGLNTMYAAFAARVREVGMLQSLGFTRPAIVFNLVEESVFIAACGAVLGAVIGLLVLDGLAVRFSMGAFAITLDGPVMLAGLLAGLVTGLVGAVPPAVRCLRLPIAEALRSS